MPNELKNCNVTLIPHNFSFIISVLVTFQVYNLAGDGFIKKAELLQVLRLMAGPNLEEEELMTLVEQTFRDADLNRDGLLDFEEFSTVKQSPFELTGFYR